MDSEDKARTLTNKQKLLAALKERRVLTNEQVRRIAGARGMGRANELIHEGHPIAVRKLRGGLWEVRYDMKPLGRDSGTRVEQKPLFDLR
jgi:hypothetical protein